MKKIICVILAIITICSAFSVMAFADDGYKMFGTKQSEYKIDGTTVTIRAIEGTLGQTESYTEGFSPFSGNPNITKVVFEEGITTIGSYLFSSPELYDHKTMEVVFPSTLKVIEKGAFKNSNIYDIILPEGLTTIGEYAFYSDYAVENGYDTIVGNTISIPSTVKEIGYRAFWIDNVGYETLEINCVVDEVRYTNVQNSNSYAIDDCFRINYNGMGILTINKAQDCKNLIRFGSFYLNLACGSYYCNSVMPIYCDTVAGIIFTEMKTLDYNTYNTLIKKYNNFKSSGQSDETICNYFKFEKYAKIYGIDISKYCYHTILTKNDAMCYFGTPKVTIIDGDHTFTNYVYNNDATCSKNGTETAKCEYCNATNTREAENTKIGHNYKETVIKPTCYSIGYTIKTCTECGYKEIVDKTELIEHTFEEMVVEPTCTSKGYTVRYCTECDYEEITNETDTIEHNIEVINQIEVTKTEPGYTGDAYCTICGEIVGYGEIVPVPQKKSEKRNIAQYFTEFVNKWLNKIKAMLNIIG